MRTGVDGRVTVNAVQRVEWGRKQEQGRVMPGRLANQVNTDLLSFPNAIHQRITIMHK